MGRTRAARPLTGAVVVAGALTLTGCAQQGATRDAGSAAPRSYLGIETQLLADDLVNFNVKMDGVQATEDLERYGRCAAGQYALIRGYGFARHVRTTVYTEGGLWLADAVYTISPALPKGLQTLDAEVVVADCAENGIPMV